MTRPKADRTAQHAAAQHAAAAAARNGVGRWLGPMLVAGVGALVLAVAARWLDDSASRALLAGMAAGLLLGGLLRVQASALLAAASVVVVWCAFATGAWLAGEPPLPAAVQGALPALASAIAYALLRSRQLDPTGLSDLSSFARSMAVAVLLVPAGYVLGTLALAVIDASDVPRVFLAAALGVIATLPALLARPVSVEPAAASPQYRSMSTALAVLAWVPLPLLLWWRPDTPVLGLLPVLALASGIGVRATAYLALLVGLTIAAFGATPGLGLALSTPAAVLSICAALLAALVIAILTSQRDRAARALMVAQDQLHAVTERNPALVATLGADLRHQSANRAYLQWLGLDAAQVLGRTLQEIYSDGAAALAAPVRRALVGQAQRQQITLPDGRVLDAGFEPRFSPAGPVDGVHLLAQDASWRTAHTRSLQSMLAAAVDPTLLLDATGLIVRLDGKVEALMGSPAEAMMGQRLAEWLLAPADAALADALSRLHDDRQPRTLARSLGLHARRSDGSSFPVELRLTPLDTGPAVEVRALQIVVTLHDLGPQLALEELATRGRGQAEVTLDAIGEAVVACNLEERITIFNPAASRLSGWAGHDAVGRTLSEVLRFADATDGTELPSLLREAMRRNAIIRQKGDRTLLQRDGARVAVEESAAPIRDSFGQTSGGVLLLHNVSQLQAQAQSLAHQAQHDHLTGLPNRVLLQDRLSQALAQMDRGYKGALLYLDLDHFKPINDRLGHPVGDRVLQEVASRLRAGVRDDDTVSRQGGDEFVLLLVRLADPRDAARVAEKLINAIEQPIHVDGHELSVSASIGIALFPQDGRDTATLTKQADTALYHAKQAGRGRYSYFTDLMSASAEERMRTEHDLRIALSSGDFFLEWQPQVQLLQLRQTAQQPAMQAATQLSPPPGQQRIAGVEALVRWRQADGGVATPEDFIPVAEETGLVVQIDEWVLAEACRQHARWQAQGLPTMPVSVNVSLARFDAERLLTHVRDVLRETGIGPGMLELEFQAAQLFAQAARGQALVTALKGLGVRVAADDFGSGQAGVGTLAGFAFDTLKVERGYVESLVDDGQARVITEAILGIGRAMGYRVVAKGVETQAQYDALMRMGCDRMQGLMFGEATSAQQLAQRLAHGDNAAVSREA